MRPFGMGDTGFEPDDTKPCMGNELRQSCDAKCESAAPGAAFGARIESEDHRLGILIEAWPGLPDHTKSQILLLVEKAVTVAH